MNTELCRIEPQTAITTSPSPPKREREGWKEKMRQGEKGRWRDTVKDRE